MEQTLELYPYGDTELWYASGDDWALPVHVQWRHDKKNDKHYGMIIPAVGLYYSQGLMMNSLMGMHDIMGRKDRWLIPRPVVDALLHKAPGITAIAYYKWPDPEMPAIPIPSVLKVDKASGEKFTELATDAMENPGQEPFIKFISSKTGINSSIVRVVMRAICDDAPQWMLEHRREVDLGFCKLIAAPFRPNWKEIVAFKFKRWKLLEMFSSPGDLKYQMLEDAGVPSALCSLHNIAIKKDSGRHQVSYSLEAIPNRRFEKAVAEVERKRIACGSTSYVVSFEKTVESLYRHLLDALEGYLKKTNLPFARLCEDSSSGNLRLLSSGGEQAKVRGVGIRQLPVHIIPPGSPFSVKAERSDRVLVQAQAPPLPKMPTILPRLEDVRGRDGEQDLAAEGSNEEGTAGVPVLDACEGKNSGKPVLPCATLGTGDSSGMDRC